MKRTGVAGLAGLGLLAGDRKVVAALSKVGYVKDRQKGSQIVLGQLNSPHRRVMVPDHQAAAADGPFAPPVADPRREA